MASVGGNAVPHDRPNEPAGQERRDDRPMQVNSTASLTETQAMGKPEIDKAVSVKSKKQSGTAPASGDKPATVGGNRHSAARASQMGPHGLMRRRLRHFLETRFFKFISIVALIIALFGTPAFHICDVPSKPDGTMIQDMLMVVVMVFFVLEMALRMYAEYFTYPLGFFFWMDLLGTVSMLFEISFVLGTHGKRVEQQATDQNTVLLRAARASKVGARVGRFTKVVKVLNFLHRRSSEDEKSQNETEARLLNAKLMMTLSSKVAMLTIVLVMFVPLLELGRFPGDDLSLKAWVRTLEADYKQAYDSLKNSNGLCVDMKFQTTTVELKDFYSDLLYHPYQITSFDRVVNIPGRGSNCSIPGEDQIQEKAPARLENIWLQKTPTCMITRPGCTGGSEVSAIWFNFKGIKQLEAVLDIALIVFVVLVMSFESAHLSQTLDRMVVKPVERMLGTVRMMAKVLSLVTELRSDAFGEEEEMDEDIESVMERTGQPVVTEAELLDTVFSKLAKLTAVFMQSSIVDENDLTNMDYESQGVLMDIMRMEQEESRVTSVQKEAKKMQGLAVPNLRVEVSHIEGWELNLLGMEQDMQLEVTTFIIFDSRVGRLTGATWIDVEIFNVFLQAVRSGYYDGNPYHNFIHACDVVAVVFRIMLMIRAVDWLSDVDMTALVIAALCHDIGHQGKTNPFLLETSHELAMRYNDKSPLENMHCAKMFELCKDPAMNVFKRFNKDAYRQARKVCISTILHTDNALHFDMVKDVKKAYEMASDICDTQARESKDEFKQEYTQEVLQKETVLWLKLILHIADISTPLKPFFISKQWAYRVQDEFFAQGDEEKRLSLPVGMLNDRDKVNRAGSEHGFISFLVSPLVFAAVGVFYSLHPLARQMCTNMEEWKVLWVATGPSAEDIKKRDDDITKIKEKVQELYERKQLPTVRTAKTAGAK